MELGYDELLHAFYAEHVEIVHEVVRICVNTSPPRVDQVFQDKILGLMRAPSGVEQVLPHE